MSATGALTFDEYKRVVALETGTLTSAVGAVAPNGSLATNCNFYKMFNKRGPNGDLSGSYGYIDDCHATCDLSKTYQIGNCGSISYDSCDDLCRNASPFADLHPSC